MAGLVPAIQSSSSATVTMFELQQAVSREGAKARSREAQENSTNAEGRPTKRERFARINFATSRLRVRLFANSSTTPTFERWMAGTRARP
jgi:hypothetical protein